MAVAAISGFGVLAQTHFPSFSAHLSGTQVKRAQAHTQARRGSLNPCLDLILAPLSLLMGQLSFPRGLPAFSGVRTAHSVHLVLLFSLPRLPPNPQPMQVLIPLVASFCISLWTHRLIPIFLLPPLTWTLCGLHFCKLRGSAHHTCLLEIQAHSSFSFRVFLLARLCSLCPPPPQD